MTAAPAQPTAKSRPVLNALVALVLIAPLAVCAYALPPHVPPAPDYVDAAHAALVRGYSADVYPRGVRCVTTQADGAWLAWCGAVATRAEQPPSGVYRILPDGAGPGWRLVTVNGTAATHAGLMPGIAASREPDISRDTADIAAAKSAAGRP